MSENPYQSPSADITTEDNEERVYAGFWIRAGASIIDTILIMIVTWPVLIGIYGDDYYNTESMLKGTWDFLISYIFPAIVVIMFWVYRSATPGKMLLNIKIIDDKTGAALTKGQSIGRYFGYFVSMLPLFLGMIWIAFDKQKQGWHDKLAGTVCVRNK